MTILLGFKPVDSLALSGNVLPVAKKGMIDLRNQSLSQIIPLNGQWFFYWHQLLDPGKPVTEKGTLVNFPFRWEGATLNNEKLPSFGYASYKLQVLLPPHRDVLRMALQDTYCAYRLYINGRLMASNGVVSTSKKKFVPEWKYRTFDILPGTDTLNITLQIANFAHSRGGIRNELIIAKKDIVRLARQRTEAIDLLLTGCLIMGGLFFFGLYLLGNRDKAILLFAVFSTIYSYRVIGVDNYVLHSLLPSISWYITIRLEYITLFAGIGIFGLYNRYLYPEDVNNKILNAIIFTCFTFSAATLFLPPLYFTQLTKPFFAMMIGCLVYLPAVYISAYRNKRPGNLYSLISSFVLMLIFAINLFHYWDLIPPLQLLCAAAYIAFFFLQSLSLSNRVSFLLKKARKEAEQGLLAKSEFLSTMSHEIRTPLNSVIGISHLLLKNNPRKDQEAQLEVLLFSANNLLAIVNDILDYSKIEAGKISFEYIETDIVSILSNVLKGMQNRAQDKGLLLKLNIDKNLQCHVLTDPTRLTQVITNLLHNAIKFTHEGYVEAKLEVTEETEKAITLKLLIKDTGIGISKDKQKLIFERFTQADSSTCRGYGGTGLGLAICKKILELQGSELQLSSEPGKGSVFYFTQTFEKCFKTNEQRDSENHLPREDQKPLLGYDILLVEDNPMNVMVARAFLQRWGAFVDVAQNGQEALEKLDIPRHKLILIDIHMPVMDGYTAARKMRAKGVTIPIIALTADLAKETKEEVERNGMNDVVVKPFVPDDFYKQILYYLRQTDQQKTSSSLSF